VLKFSHGQDTGDINPLQETIGQKKMTCVFLTPVVSLALLVLSVPDTDGEDRSICRIDRVQQLLLNDDLIESLHGATRKLNQSTKYSDNQLIAMVLEGGCWQDTEWIQQHYHQSPGNHWIHSLSRSLSIKSDRS